MARDPQPDSTLDSDAVMVISIWRHSSDRFLGRLTMGESGVERAVQTVTSPDELLEQVSAWLTSLR